MRVPHELDDTIKALNCMFNSEDACPECPCVFRDGKLPCEMNVARKAHQLLYRLVPIKPEKFMDGLVERFRCKCGAHLFHTGKSKWNYCPICGQAVKWE